MITLNEYLSTKIKKVYKRNKFEYLNLPKYEITNQLLEFFDDNNFVEIDNLADDEYTFADLIDHFCRNAHNSSSPIFLISYLHRYYLIRFAKNGEISDDESNPIFCCRIYKDETTQKLDNHCSIENANGSTLENNMTFQELMNKAIPRITE